MAAFVSLSTRAMKERQVSEPPKAFVRCLWLGLVCPRPPCVEITGRRPPVCLGLVAVTWAVFGQTLAHDFVNFDDHVLRL